MACTMKEIRYRISDVHSLADLVECMRYDKMRFPDTDTANWKRAIEILAARSSGVVQVTDHGLPIKITLVRDKLKGWEPTYRQWESFGMDIQLIDDWKTARTIN